MSYLACLADFVVAVAPAVTALAALGAALAAWKALSAWRDEMLGKRRSELAEDVLAKFYQAEKAISIIRSPVVGTSESEGREREPDETEKESKILDTYYVPLARIQSQNELFADLYAKRFRMKALFGPDSEKPFATLDFVLRRIIVAARMLPSVQANEKLRGEHEDIIYETKENDELATKMKEALAEIEAICGPELERKR